MTRGQSDDVFDVFDSKIGKIKLIKINDKSSPPIVPTASENQNTSFSPPIKKGISPKQVDNSVSVIGFILAVTTFTNPRLVFLFN